MNTYGAMEEKSITKNYTNYTVYISNNVKSCTS